MLLELADGVVLTTTPDHVSLTDTDKPRQLAELADSEIVGALIVVATGDTGLREIDAGVTFPVLVEKLERVFFEDASGADLEMIPEQWFREVPGKVA